MSYDSNIEPLGSRGGVPPSVAQKKGKYQCSCETKTVLGLVALVAGAALLILAVVFASGVFGGAKMGFVAGALTIGSMLTFGIAVTLLVPRHLKSEQLGQALERLESQG